MKQLGTIRISRKILTKIGINFFFFQGEIYIHELRQEMAQNHNFAPQSHIFRTRIENKLLGNVRFIKIISVLVLKLS